MAYSFQEQRIPGGIGADDRFWESLEDGGFRLPRCADCQRWMWPAHYRCGACGSWEQVWESVPMLGAVYSWTRSHYAFDRTRDRAADTPYVVVVAELAGADGARVVGVLAGSEDGLRVGAPVHGHIDPPSAKSLGYAAVRWSLGEA
jgi:uncharacterized OB-fold protein